MIFRTVVDESGEQGRDIENSVSADASECEVCDIPEYKRDNDAQKSLFIKLPEVFRLFGRKDKASADHQKERNTRAGKRVQEKVYIP